MNSIHGIAWIALAANLGIGAVVIWAVWKNACIWPTWRRVSVCAGGATAFTVAGLLCSRDPELAGVALAASWAAVLVVAAWLLSYIVRVERRNLARQVAYRKTTHLDTHAFH